MANELKFKDRKCNVGDEVVITGMAGKFPDSHNIYHFRDNLFNKVDMVSEDFRRWKPVYAEIPQRTGKLYDIEKFDAGCFGRLAFQTDCAFEVNENKVPNWEGFLGVTSRQSNSMEPMMRMLLERTYEAITDAGYHPLDFEGTRTGVFLASGLSGTECFTICRDLIPKAEAIIGTQRSQIAQRLSYCLKVKGPVHTLDSACSSSLFALYQAYHSIKEGLCDKAIVCGTHLCLNPIVSLQCKRLGTISSDGICKSFDAKADGYARSEAVVAIILERASDAKRIYSEIIHAKTHCDGYKKEGILAPSSKEQKALLKDFYAECKIDPTALTYMECHGSGTRAGDSEELEAVDHVLCKDRIQPLHIGAVKSNMGHSEPASGLCSVVKLVLSMEMNSIPPNLHYQKPAKGVEGLQEGRMVVATDKMPLPDQRGLFGVNNFGFGGLNSHVLLRWNPKHKVNDGQPKDELPRLICLSSRVVDGVNSILDDYKTRRCDAEFTYLIHQAFRKSMANHLYRGYGIYNKHGEMKRCLNEIKVAHPFPRKLYLVFSSFDKEWLNQGDRLMEIPIFAQSMKTIQNILLDAADIELVEVIKKSSEESLINQILASVAIQISLAHMLKELNLIPDSVMGFGSGELVAAYLDDYLTLEETILGLLCLTNNKNLENLEKILPPRKYTCEKWIPVHKEELSCDSAKYFANSIITDTNSFDLKRIIPAAAFTLVIGPHLNNLDNNHLDLINLNGVDCVVDLLINLGSLYINGFDMELNKLYPPVKLPVSRGTPMLSPLIKWNRNDWNVCFYKTEAELEGGHKVVYVEPRNEEWNFILGHVVDGRNLFPGTGYLVLAWQSFAIMVGKPLSEMKVVFENLNCIRAAIVPKEGSVKLTVSIQTATQEFQVVEADEVIVTGKIYEKTNEQSLVDVASLLLPNAELIMSERDVYKELKLRGYDYTGKFRGIKRCSADASSAIIEWEDNWISFMDCVLQTAIFQRDIRNTFLPTSVGQIIVDAPKHIDFVKKMKNAVPVFLCKDFGLIRSGGVQINGIHSSLIARRKIDDPVLEVSKFIANVTQLEFQHSVKSLVQIVLENSSTVTVKVTEICTEKQDEDDLLCPVIQASLNDTPLIRQEVVLLTSKAIFIPEISTRNNHLKTESHCLILVVKNLLETIDILVAINAIKDVKGFVISRETLNVDLSKFSSSPFLVVCSYKVKKETLVLLRPHVKIFRETEFLDLSNALENLDIWIVKLQDLLKKNCNIVLYAQNEELSGILGLVSSLRREFFGSKVSCVFIMDEAPKFDPKLPFYKNQLEKGMAINVWKDESWGTYRYLTMPQGNLAENENCHLNVTSSGELPTMVWTEGKLSGDESTSFQEDKIFIYYAALNSRDLMIASGKISPDAVTADRIEQDCIQWFEFAGRDSNGQRVMGVSVSGGLSTCVKSKNILPIPDHWTMEDAATVMVTYGIVLEVLCDKFEVQSGQSILIHPGIDGIEHAAINLCFHFGLVVFVTVGTPEKRDYIRKHYPQIEDHHIGSSKDVSFEDMIRKHTNGEGVDYVLNTLTEEKLLASVRCLARGGKFLNIGRFDPSSNNLLALHLLERDAYFFGMSSDISLNYKHIVNLRTMENLVNKDVIKPLPRTVFDMDDVEKAFRYMAVGKHVGKVLIKVREEEPEKVHPVPRKLFKAVPRFYCKPECSYVIYGGLGGFGLELADLLVLRGAKKLVLTSRSGVCNGYQRYRISVWKRYGVTVITTVLDASTEEGCIELLNTANKLGFVDGIFNLAVVLKDALFENQSAEKFKAVLMPKAYCTKNFDDNSRKLCPNLRYFVVFSSVTSGRGNIGQTNYGMANSVMERICEKRKKEGYPALAIQWGAIGEVGFVAEMQKDGRELVIAGTSQQRISSCLQVVDQFLSSQDEPIVACMLVVEKKRVEKVNNLFEEVKNMLGVINTEFVSMHVTFPKLGMDSLTAVEIKQRLENEYGVLFTSEEIRNLTLAKLKEFSDSHDCATMLATPINESEMV